MALVKRSASDIYEPKQTELRDSALHQFACKFLVRGLMSANQMIHSIPLIRNSVTTKITITYSVPFKTFLSKYHTQERVGG